MTGSVSCSLGGKALLSQYSPLNLLAHVVRDARPSPVLPRTTRLDGVIGGGQVGYSYQLTPNWIAGFEADFQGSAERGSGTFTDAFSALICANGGTGSCSPTGPVSGTTVTSYQAKIDWFGTVRGRLGVLLTDQVLFYATGGLAYGRVILTGTNIIGNISLANGNPSSSAAFSAAKTNVGFSVGGGMEGRLLPLLPANWTWKLEYIYLDLGSLTSATSAVLPFAAGASANTYQTQLPPPPTPISPTTSCASG